MDAKMIREADDTVPVLITWGYNATKGDIYLDAFLNLEKNPEAAKMIFLRATSQNVNVAFLQIPEGAEREDIEGWLKFGGDDSIKLLKKARVSDIGQIMRRREESNTADYILNML